MFNELATICQDELNLNLYVLSPETQLQITWDVSKVYETLTTESNRDSIPKFEYLTLNWIRAFLLGRTQAVVLEGERSAEAPVTSGVPQGSVLGPLLFLLYINDLPQDIQSQVRLFADDTAVYLTVTSLEDANTLQTDLDTLQEWERTWDMEFNPGKCQVLHVTRSMQPLQSNYTLHGQVLESFFLSLHNAIRPRGHSRHVALSSIQVC